MSRRKPPGRADHCAESAVFGPWNATWQYLRIIDSQAPEFPDVIGTGDLRLVAPSDTSGPELFATIKDPRVWQWMPAVKPQSPAQMQALIDKWNRDRSSGRRVAYLVEVDGAIAGNISLYDYDSANDTIESGFTWLAPEYWGTGVNQRMKLLLYDFAFGALGVERLAVRTDNLNLPAQRALEAMGMHREGVMRSHIRRPDGTMRDSVYYSIIADEWPVIRAQWAARSPR